MDPTTLRPQLVDDLRRRFRGQILVDYPSRKLYATDASLFEVDPLAIAIPRDEADLTLLVRHAADRSIPLILRGAGTGVTGGCLGRGIVVDLGTHFRSVLDMSEDWVRVQAGIPLAELNSRLAAHGRRFAPDSDRRVSTTIGGMVAIDASGRHAAIHGSICDHTRHLRVVWDDGTADDVHPPSSVWNAKSEQRTRKIRIDAETLLSSRAEILASSRPRVSHDGCGYRLSNALDSTGVNLLRLLVGSEGTLGIITEATLGTLPLPGGKSGAMLGFASLEAALQVAQGADAGEAASCQVLDRRLISLACAQRPRLAALIPPEIEAVLLIDFEADSPSSARSALLDFRNRLSFGPARPVIEFLTDDPDCESLVDHFYDAAIASLSAPKNGPRPLAVAEDIGVPRDRLSEFVSRAQVVLRQFDISAALMIDARIGHVQLRPILDAELPADSARMWPFADELHGIALEFQGTVGVRNGIGLARTPWVEQQAGAVYPVFRELKAIFDPRELLNPGKIIGPEPGHPAWPLRFLKPSPVAEGISVGSTETVTDPPVDEPTNPRIRSPLLVWNEGELNQVASLCNGCGACRTTATSQRMCPIFRTTRLEVASPRAKANLFRGIMEGTPLDVSADELREIADHCVSCRMCATECPAQVDVPKMMLEARARNIADEGLSRSAWFQARLDGLAALGSRISITANFLLRRASVRWALEKLVGLARRRTLPAFAFQPFLSRARRRGWTRRADGPPAVAYFVDTYANVFDPAVAEATVAVLKHNGIRVHVPHRQRGTGAAALAQGDIEVARERLLANVRRLADAARAGDTIVCSEPTAALFLSRDGPNLSDDPEVQLVASRTMELTAFLWKLHQDGRLRTDFQALPLTIGHHIPCHVKALGQGQSGADLLSLIPGLNVNKIDVSCSGMAGTFGLNVHTLEMSLEVGQPMFEELSRPEYSHGSSECSACRLQMQEGTHKRVVHPILLLAYAYGLMPSVADRLRRPFKGRVSTA